MKSGFIKQINGARRARQPIALVTDIELGDQQLVGDDTATAPGLASAVSTRFVSGKSGIDIVDEREVFVQVHIPAPRLIVIGAVHISQALVPMAQACGFDVTVIDPRTGFASAERFVGVTLNAEWPENILKDQPLDRFTALVAVTHDPKIDDLPLQLALETGCFYVGALGSRKTHAKRKDRLLNAGVSEHSFDTIHAPIGLNIGAATPAEIAVAILAQMIAVRRQGAVV